MASSDAWLPSQSRRDVCTPHPMNDDTPTKTSTRTWWLCGLLFLATVLNYLDRQVLALTAEKIMGEFELSKEGLGRL